MKYQYNTEVTPLLKTFRKITVSEKKYAKIIEHVEKLIAIKIHEADYKVDHDKLRERFITGLLGEAALEELLKIHIIEWKIALHASDFNHPDIPIDQSAFLRATLPLYETTTIYSIIGELLTYICDLIVLFMILFMIRRYFRMKNE